MYFQTCNTHVVSAQLSVAIPFEVLNLFDEAGMLAIAPEGDVQVLAEGIAAGYQKPVMFC